MCCAWQSWILWKNIFAPKVRKWAKNKSKIGFFEVFGKLSHYFFLNLFYNKSLHYVLYFCISFKFGKNLIPDICAKMLFANQIVGFKSATSLKQIDEKSWFFAYWYRLMKIKNGLKNIELGMVKNGFATLVSVL